MKKRVVILASGNVIPTSKDEYDKVQLAMQRNTGRNIVMNDGGIIRTVNIEFVGIIDDEVKAPANVIQQIDDLNDKITGLVEENKELGDSVKDMAKKAVEADLEIKEKAKACKNIKKANEGLLEKIGVAEANLKAMQAKKKSVKLAKK